MIIKNVQVFTSSGQFEKGAIGVEDGKITAIYTEEACPQTDASAVDGQGAMAIPGLVDIHFHGCMGVDFCNGTMDAIETIGKYQLSQGVTSICPATMTLSEAHIGQVCQAAADFVNAQKNNEYKDCATLRGINMEGPFIAESKKGAQNAEFIHVPDVDMFNRLQTIAKGLFKLVDVAPETEGAMAFIEKVSPEVTVSLAHTAANYDIAAEAFRKGAKHVTHLYNAMLPYAHREPGVVGAACDDEKVMVELICDGIHIHPAAVRTTFKMFGDQRVILISDSMEATGMKDGQYQLGGQAVYVKGNLATLADGTIAGSATNLMDCLRTAVKKMNIPLNEAVKCATINPAKAIGIDNVVGSLEPGKQADILLIDQDLNLKAVYKAGVEK